MEYVSAIAVSLALFILSSCGNAYNNSTASNADTAVQGDWEISYLSYGNHEHTGDFSGYSFKLEKPHTIIEFHGHQHVVGVLRLMANDTAHKKCAVVFNNIDPKLAKLNDEWDVLKSDSMEIDLQRNRKSGDEQLTFRKDFKMQDRGQ